MKVLLTGAGGFLGKKIAHSLLAHGVTDLRLQFRQQAPLGFIENLVASFPNVNIESVFGNLLNAEQLKPLLEEVDCVIHAAAGMRGAAADMFANSVVGTRNLLQTAADQKVGRIVLISSFAVYRTHDLKTGSVVSESTSLEEDGVEKGAYGFAKTQQEAIFRIFQERYGFESIILRPGVIYGPGSGALSTRVGVQALGFFFSLGGSTLLPLTYVDNCADAVVLSALNAPNNAVYNVVDDDLPSCSGYLRQYRRSVSRIRTFPVPYWALLLGSHALLRYHLNSKGQLPAIFTPYIVRSMYRKFKYTNSALKSIGWRPAISTSTGMSRAFDFLKRKS